MDDTLTRLCAAVLPCLFVGLSAARGAAQGVVVPASHATSAGTGSTNVPFGRSTPVRAQFVYDATSFDQTAALTFSTLDLRLEEGLTAAAKPVELEIFASSLGQSVTRVQATFAMNRGIDAIVIFDRKLVTLPAAGAAAGSPNAFDVTIPMDRPFTFDPSSGGALVLEFVVHGQPPGAYTLDTTFVCDSAQRGFGPAGCGPLTGGPVLGADSVTTQVTWGGNVTLRIMDAEPGTLTAFLFGFQDSGSWQGLTLPFDLGVIGATGCSLSLGVVGSVTAAADGTGTALFSMFMPSRLELVGDWIRFQGIAIAPNANPLGITTSQAHEVQICGWEPTARVFAGGVSATTGLREIGVAPVLRLR